MSRSRGLGWWAANVILPGLFLLLTVAIVWARRDEMAAIFEDPDGDLIAIAVLVVIGHFVNSSEFWLLYRAQGIRLGLVENWMVFTAGQLGNLAPGQLGTLYKFRYLKAIHGLGYAKSSSNYGANLLISFGSSSVAGLAGAFGVAADGGHVAWWLFAGFAALGVMCIGSFFVAVPSVPLLRGRLERAWEGFREGWDELRREPGTALAVFGLDLGKYVLVAIRFQIAFSLLGVDESLWYFLVIAPAAGLAGAIAFTPGGFGFRETFVTVAAVGLGSDFDTGLLAATIDRGVMLVSSIVLGGIGYLYTWRRMAAVAPSTN